MNVESIAANFHFAKLASTFNTLSKIFLQNYWTHSEQNLFPKLLDQGSTSSITTISTGSFKRAKHYCKICGKTASTSNKSPVPYLKTIVNCSAFPFLLSPITFHPSTSSVEHTSSKNPRIFFETLKNPSSAIP